MPIFKFYLTCFAPRFLTRHSINAVCPVYTVIFLEVVCWASIKYGSIFNSGPIGIPTTFAEGPLVAMIGIPANAISHSFCAMVVFMAIFIDAIFYQRCCKVFSIKHNYYFIIINIAQYLIIGLIGIPSSVISNILPQ